MYATFSKGIKWSDPALISSLYILAACCNPSEYDRGCKRSDIDVLRIDTTPVYILPAQ